MSSPSFDYTYELAESIYMLEGEATVTTQGFRGQSVTLRPGMFVTFPKGLKVRNHAFFVTAKHMAFSLTAIRRAVIPLLG